ncbi:MAG: DUF2993 domain-containing protein [Selenomonadales bacterium]|nr:DUF2993 domain-containing protein [Selenomonadales bacterium]
MTLKKYLLFGLAFFLFISEMVLPITAEVIIENSLRGSLQARELTADVSARIWQGQLISGEADTIRIHGKDVQIGKLLCSEVEVSAHDVDVDMTRLLGDGKLLFEHLGEVTAYAYVKEEALAKVLEQSSEKLSKVAVHITPSGIEAEGNYALGRLPVRISLTGQLVGRDNKIYFVSERAMLQHAIGKISAHVKTEVEAADLSSLPFAVRITDIRSEDGRVYIIVKKEDTSAKHTQ